jgi:AcrR family transcriptional regulator
VTSVEGVASRRDRVRTATIEEIKDAARAVIAAEGGGAVTFAAAARQMRIVPSALYRYFRDRDELLTALVADAYDSLGAAVEAAVAACAARPADRLTAGLRAFRDWSLAHRVDFALVYGPPIPAHHVVGSETTRAALRVSDILFDALGAAGPAGTASEVAPSLRIAIGHTAAFARLTRHDPETDATTTIVTGLLAWLQLYGFVAAEVFGHLPAQLQPPDVAQALFDAPISDILHDLQPHGETQAARAEGRCG